jgi:predicted dehydrogenase
MLEFDGVDAIYVATPTFVREEICVAAADAGKHVLGEKPFANLPSLRRITAACRSGGVGFMDGTHFVHHPRTAEIKRAMADRVGWPSSVASAFQFSIDDPDNIRLNPKLEPYGAIGDAGWYNMRAAVEFLSAGVSLVSAESCFRRGGAHDPVVAGAGILQFDDGSTSTWDCGFQSGAVIMDLRISGAKGVVELKDFVLDFGDPAVYEHVVGWGANGTTRIEVPAGTPAAARMFEDFTAMIGDPERVEASMRASERTQEWLDAAWASGIANENA